MTKKHRYGDYARYANMAISLGVTMIVSIFLGFYAGDWLDRRFNTAPWLMLAGVLAGVAVGFSSIWGELKALEKKLNSAASGKKRPPDNDQTDNH